jgi:hypothetical protein
VSLIAAGRTVTLFSSEEEGDEILEPEQKDQPGYEFAEIEFQRAEDHAREAADSLEDCEIEFLAGMLKKAAYFSPSVHMGQATDTRH